MNDPTRRKKNSGTRARAERLTLKGTVVEGLRHFSRRMTEFPEVFRKATGETLYPGTVNVDVETPIPIHEQSRIIGVEIGEPHQDLLFEPCLVNGIPAWRIRPYVLVEQPGFPVGTGGHGDHILEISCATKIPNASPGSQVEVTFLRGTARKKKGRDRSRPGSSV